MLEHLAPLLLPGGDHAVRAVLLQQWRCLCRSCERPVWLPGRDDLVREGVGAQLLPGGSRLRQLRLRAGQFVRVHNDGVRLGAPDDDVDQQYLVVHDDDDVEHLPDKRLLDGVLL